jgi:glutathione S-transferase
MMITLYHAPYSRSTRMIWLLEELGVPYEIRQVSIFRPLTGEGAADPANPHPDKRVPAIEHDGSLVAESVAIVLYLTDAFPEARLGPAVGDASRGTYLTWLAWYAAELEPALFAGLAGELAGSPQKQRSYEVVLQRLHGALADGPYIMGERFSGADFLIASAIAFGRHVLPASPAIDAYLARCQSRPAAARALALENAAGIQRAA